MRLSEEYIRAEVQALVLKLAGLWMHKSADKEGSDKIIDILRFTTDLIFKCTYSYEGSLPTLLEELDYKIASLKEAVEENNP